MKLSGQNLNHIVTGLLVVAVAYILVDNYFIDQRALQTKEFKTIAILPFENLSSDPDQEYFVDGLSEEILNSLIRIPNLRVISRSSSFAFKGADKNIQEIANILGADYILKGSVEKTGNALSITAKLIRAADSYQPWARTYDREFRDIFTVQEEVAATIGYELESALRIETYH